MIRLDGLEVSKHIRSEIKKQALLFLQEYKRSVKLVVILVGENKASEVYVSSKAKACIEVGFESEVVRLPENVEEEKFESELLKFANDANVDGILVQLPLPKQISLERVIQIIPPAKDVDCFTPTQVGLLALNRSVVKPCTPAGVMEILKYYKISTEGKDVTVIGRSHIVGSPMAQMLSHANATVTLCHSKTRHLDAITRNADIVVAAIGKPHFISKKQIKKGAVIIDVGIHKKEIEGQRSHLVGDVDPSGLDGFVTAMTPVPGGVGPMTITMLLQNTLTLAKMREQRK